MIDDRTALGIDVGGTNIRIAEIDRDGAILRRHIERVIVARDGFLSRATDLVRDWNVGRVAAIGIGTPGRVDAPARRILSAGYLDLADAPLVERLEAATGLPVAIENDCGMALVAELAIGAAKNAANVVMFTIGTGIGGAIALHGRLVHGHVTAGQLGHITVQPNGAVCNCGRRGCVETTSSGTALGRHLSEAGFPVGITVETLFQRADAGDGAAVKILDDWARPMRDAVTSMVAALDPDLVLIGGGLGHSMCLALDRLPVETSWYRSTIVPASLGDDAGVIGAGLQALTVAEDLAARPVQCLQVSA